MSGTPAPGPSVAGAGPEADEERRRGLRRMRVVAGSLLVLAAVVFLLARDRGGFWGFVEAGAEAAMIGAIADWFAVTALFRHPLRIPVPHTALVPKRKDELGKGLQEFVAENFLHERIVRERVLAAEPAARIGAWLRDPEHARRVADEGATLAAAALGRVRDEHVAALVSDALLPRFREEPVAPLAGQMLAEVLRDDLHHGLVDLVLDELHAWLLENEEIVTEVLGERAPWWAPERLNEAVTSRVHLEATRWVRDIRDDPQHRARAALDSWLRRLAHDLQLDDATRARTEAFKERVLDSPTTVATAVSLWNALRRALLGSLRDQDGEVRRRALAEITRAAQRLEHDAGLRAVVDGLAADAAAFVAERYGTELTTVITHTIERWDGEEAARRIELHVGRDLQFIRINGTVVGGLVGVVIHALVVLLG